MQKDLELPAVRLTANSVALGYGVALTILGVTTDVLGDARFVRLVRRALEYRRAKGAVVTFEDRGRLSVRLNDYPTHGSTE